MLRIIKSVSIAEWTPDDIDRFEQHITSLCKVFEYEHYITDVDSLADTIASWYDKDNARRFGHWKYKGHAIFVRADMLEVSILFGRVRLIPDAEGKVNIVKWEKEQN